jgi:two-component system invasion response regulator UvrY
MKRILLADDHAIFRAGLTRVLADTPDLRVAGEAASGDEAMRALAVEPFDALILDVSMPGRTGLDILGDVVALYPAMPVLMLSAHPEEQYALRALKLGAAGYLTKQSAPSELIVALRRVLERRRYVSVSLAERLAQNFAEGERPAPHERLSERERQVILRLARGLTVKEIGAQLHISPKTASTYRTRLLEKMGLDSNAALTRYAVENGLLD